LLVENCLPFAIVPPWLKFWRCDRKWAGVFGDFAAFANPANL
jgi:hypothetical protein